MSKGPLRAVGWALLFGAVMLGVASLWWDGADRWIVWVVAMVLGVAAGVVYTAGQE